MSYPPAPQPGILSTYAARLAAFRPNARLYLVSAIITGAAMGVYRLLFNFYALSLGFDEAILGNLITTSSLTALLLVLPMGYWADALGRKRSLIIGGIGLALAVGVMVALPSVVIFYAMNIVIGAAQALAGVTMAPFLMENSGEEERIYLFSISAGLQTASAFAGSWIGGLMPTWIAGWTGALPTSAFAYRGSLLAIALVAGVGVIPLVLMRMPRLDHAQRSMFTPIAYARSHPALLSKLIFPVLVTYIGAGLIMPFMNVFFRQVYHQPDPVIGTLFAWGSLAMGVGLMIAPPLADRMGKIKLVVITQGLSIPFLILLGFSPWFWLSGAAYYVRLALMNMSGPVYQTFVMEHVEPSSRATVASLVSMANSFGWAFSPAISGWLQVRYGFGPPFIGTIALYTISVWMYWAYFWRGRKNPDAAPAVAAE